MKRPFPLDFGGDTCVLGFGCVEDVGFCVAVRGAGGGFLAEAAGWTIIFCGVSVCVGGGFVLTSVCCVVSFGGAASDWSSDIRSVGGVTRFLRIYSMGRIS